ncbi:MAG: hypothetical protein LBJ96_03700 [Holosporaceae bacterium]|jgi:hypothetical protein|nr:hypothetical protein [Holosporaceae bacterium]
MNLKAMLSGAVLAAVFMGGTPDVEAVVYTTASDAPSQLRPIDEAQYMEIFHFTYEVLCSMNLGGDMFFSECESMVSGFEDHYKAWLARNGKEMPMNGYYSSR